MFHVGNYSVNKPRAVSKSFEGMNIIDISGPTKLITGEPILSLEQTFYFRDSQWLESSGHIWKNGCYGGYGPSQNIYTLKSKKCLSTATIFIFFWGQWKYRLWLEANILQIKK